MILNPTIFIHCGNTDEKYIPIMDEYFKAIEKSVYKDKVNIIVSCVGTKRDNEPWFQENYYSDNFIEGELFTLKKLKLFCDNLNSNIPVAYINTKGTFNGFNNPCIIDWRQYMTYFILEKMEICINEIYNGYDAVGVDWNEIPNKHFSGNFWWASSEYIKSLPPADLEKTFIHNLPTERHFAEFWIGCNSPKIKCLHNSNIDVYYRHIQRYPRINYDQ